MNYGNIITYDTGNAHGISTVLFVSGCTHNCPGCHNKESQDFNYGKKFTQETIDKIVSYMNNPYVDNLVISGGDPLEPENIDEVKKLCETVKERCPGKPIILYTGYILSDNLNTELWKYNNIFFYVDYVIDGPFINALKPKNTQLRGSINQHCYIFTMDNDGDLNMSDITNNYF